MLNMLGKTPRLDQGLLENREYFDTTGTNQNFKLGSNGSIADPHVLSTLFTSSLLPRYQAQYDGLSKNPVVGLDAFGNPLIPILDEAVTYLHSNESAGGWYNVSEAAGQDFHASLLGIALSPPTDNGTSLWNISSAYWRFGCERPKRMTMAQIKSTGAQLYASASGTLFMDMHMPSPGVPGNITYAASLYDTNDNTTTSNTTFAFSTCTMNQIFVDSELNCTSRSCVVKNMRYTPGNPSPVAAAPFHRTFLDLATGYSTNGTPTLVERYIDAPNQAFTGASIGTLYIDIDGENPNLPSPSYLQPRFEERLSILLNTFWHFSFAPAGQAKVGDSSELYRKDGNGTWSSTEVTIYSVNWAWLSVLIICSVILLTAGITSAIWEHQTIGPDILGFASSIVRQSKYIALPKGDSTMTGSQRARMLADEKVMMQDVKPNAEHGKIALGTITEKSQRLQHGRLYK
jgi:hypothetical protein